MKDNFYWTSAWRLMRFAVLRRDRWRCVVCGRNVRAKGESRVDHIEPRRKRPDLSLVMSNLRTLCSSCDNKRHSERNGMRPERPEIALDGLPAAWR